MLFKNIIFFFISAVDRQIVLYITTEAIRSFFSTLFSETGSLIIGLSLILLYLMGVCALADNIAD